MIFQKKKTKRSLIIPLRSSFQKKKALANNLGLAIKPFHRENDLNVKKHNSLFNQLERELTLIIKSVRRFPVEVVQQDITNQCEKTLNLIKADLSAIRLVVKQGQTKCKHMLDNFEKELLIKKYTNEYIQKYSETLQKHKHQLTEYVEVQKTKRHLILENLKQLKHETEDYLFEQCKGETPNKKWFND